MLMFSSFILPLSLFIGYQLVKDQVDGDIDERHAHGIGDGPLVISAKQRATCGRLKHAYDIGTKPRTAPHHKRDQATQAKQRSTQCRPI